LIGWDSWGWVTEASRSVADTLKLKVGLVPAREQDIRGKITGIQADLRRHERESQLAVDDIRKEVRQKLDGLDASIRVLNGRIDQLERGIEASVRGAVNSWATETGKIQTIVGEAEANRSRTLAAQTQAVKDCDRLIDELEQAQQAIVEGGERIHEVEFEAGVREQLARKGAALGTTQRR
jgi:phage-related minor tail protein